MPFLRATLETVQYIYSGARSTYFDAVDTSDTSGRLAITPILSHLEGVLDQLTFSEEAITKVVEQVVSDTSDTLELAEQYSEHSFMSVWQLNQPSFPYLSDLSSVSSTSESLYSTAHSSMPDLQYTVDYDTDVEYDADTEDTVPASALFIYSPHIPGCIYLSLHLFIYLL